MPGPSRGARCPGLRPVRTRPTPRSQFLRASSTATSLDDSHTRPGTSDACPREERAGCALIASPAYFGRATPPPLWS